MNAADLLGYMAAWALACIAFFLVLTGIKNTIHAYTLAKVTRLQAAVSRTADVVLEAHDARIDGVTARTEGTARILAALLEDLGPFMDLATVRDATNGTGPAESESAGPCDQSSPPAASPVEEGQA